ncbi:hypothetical protein BC831DRAFT_474959 [Entophlyctis helioformis]|nr:hypothetical protein BC831DRAFT_474959 [Entophlyctis helioformis]
MKSWGTPSSSSAQLVPAVAPASGHSKPAISTSVYTNITSNSASNAASPGAMPSPTESRPQRNFRTSLTGLTSLGISILGSSSITASGNAGTYSSSPVPSESQSPAASSPLMPRSSYFSSDASPTSLTAAAISASGSSTPPLSAGGHGHGSGHSHGSGSGSGGVGPLRHLTLSHHHARSKSGTAGLGDAAATSSSSSIRARVVAANIGAHAPAQVLSPESPAVGHARTPTAPGGVLAHEKWHVIDDSKGIDLDSAAEIWPGRIEQADAPSPAAPTPTSALTSAVSPALLSSSNTQAAPIRRFLLDFEQLPKAEIKRQEVIHEIITTEAEYVRDLKIILDLFQRGMRQKKLVPDDGLQTIFSNTDALLELNQKFLQKLRDRRSHDFGIVQDMGDIFVEMAEEFKIYNVFCANHPAAIEYIQSLKSNEFLTFLQYCTLRPECRGMDIGSFLLKPIQRICKYPLLLRELSKHTHERHTDYLSLQAASQAISDVVNYVNEMRRQVENRQRVDIALARLEFNDTLILPRNPDRTLVCEGFLLKPTPGTGSKASAMKMKMIAAATSQQRWCVLFRDCLVIAKPSLFSSATSRAMVNAIYSIWSISISNVQDTDRLKHAFDVNIDGKKQLLLAASSEKEKRVWVNGFALALEETTKMLAQRHTDAVPADVPSDPDEGDSSRSMASMGGGLGPLKEVEDPNGDTSSSRQKASSSSSTKGRDKPGTPEAKRHTTSPHPKRLMIYDSRSRIDNVRAHDSHADDDGLNLSQSLPKDYGSNMSLSRLAADDDRSHDDSILLTSLAGGAASVGLGLSRPLTRSQSTMLMLRDDDPSELKQIGAGHAAKTGDSSKKHSSAACLASDFGMMRSGSVDSLVQNSGSPRPFRRQGSKTQDGGFGLMGVFGDLFDANGQLLHRPGAQPNSPSMRGADRRAISPQPPACAPPPRYPSVENIKALADAGSSNVHDGATSSLGSSIGRGASPRNQRRTIKQLDQGHGPQPSIDGQDPPRPIGLFTLARDRMVDMDASLNLNNSAPAHESPLHEPLPTVSHSSTSQIPSHHQPNTVQTHQRSGSAAKSADRKRSHTNVGLSSSSTSKLAPASSLGIPEVASGIHAAKQSTLVSEKLADGGQDTNDGRQRSLARVRAKFMFNNNLTVAPVACAKSVKVDEAHAADAEHQRTSTLDKTINDGMDAGRGIVRAATVSATASPNVHPVNRHVSVLVAQTTKALLQPAAGQAVPAGLAPPSASSASGSAAGSTRPSPKPQPIRVSTVSTIDPLPAPAVAATKPTPASVAPNSTPLDSVPASGSVTPTIKAIIMELTKERDRSTKKAVASAAAAAAITRSYDRCAKQDAASNVSSVGQSQPAQLLPHPPARPPPAPPLPLSRPSLPYQPSFVKSRIAELASATSACPPALTGEAASIALSSAVRPSMIKRTGVYTTASGETPEPRGVLYQPSGQSNSSALSLANVAPRGSDSNLLGRARAGTMHVQPTSSTTPRSAVHETESAASGGVARLASQWNATATTAAEAVTTTALRSRRASAASLRSGPSSYDNLKSMVTLSSVPTLAEDEASAK